MSQVYIRSLQDNVTGLQPGTAQVYSRELFSPIFQTSILLSKQLCKHSLFFTQVEDRLYFMYIYMIIYHFARFPYQEVICSKNSKTTSFSIKFDPFRFKIRFQNSLHLFQNVCESIPAKIRTQFKLLKSFFSSSFQNSNF